MNRTRLAMLPIALCAPIFAACMEGTSSAIAPTDAMPDRASSTHLAGLPDGDYEANLHPLNAAAQQGQDPDAADGARGVALPGVNLEKEAFLKATRPNPGGLANLQLRQNPFGMFKGATGGKRNLLDRHRQVALLIDALDHVLADQMQAGGKHWNQLGAKVIP